MIRLAVANFWLRHVSKRYLRWEQDFARGRAGIDRAMQLMPMPRGFTAAERVLAAGGRDLAALRVAAKASAGQEGPMSRQEGPIILWLHGGAYCLGSSAGYAPFLAALAARLGGEGVLPSYRLAPEHPFPAAVEDGHHAYRALLAEGIAPQRLVLGGDSAGGGLALAVLHLVLEEGLPLPAAVYAISPWSDLSASGESLRSLAAREVMLPVDRLPELREHYLAGADPRDPRASPVFGRFQGGPPVLIQSSRHEALRDDARMMAARLRDQGVAVRHDEWDSVPHVWPIFQGWLPEADRALDQAAGHLRPLLRPHLACAGKASA